MRGDSRFDVFRKIRIDSRRDSAGIRAMHSEIVRRTGSGVASSGSLRPASAAKLRLADHSHRLRVPLDDDFGSGLDLLQNGPYIPSQIALTDVQRLHTMIITFLPDDDLGCAS